MTAELLSSKIVVQEESASTRTIQGVATGVVCYAGLAQKGPVGVATLLNSFDAFVKIFGSDISAGFAASVARGFFNSGGRRMYFTRVVHYADITSAATKASAQGTLTIKSKAGIAAPATVSGNVTGPFSLTPGENLVISHDAAADLTATFNATQAKVSSTDPGPFDLSGSKTLLLKINDGAVQTITFLAADFITATIATVQEVIDALNARLSGASAIPEAAGFSIVSNRRGSTSKVEITGGTGETELGLATSIASGTGNVADISAVTVAEVKTVVEAAVTGVTVSSVGTGQVRLTSTVIGSTGKIQVKPASTAATELGFDTAAHNGTTGIATDTLRIDAKYDGGYAANITVLIGNATSGDPTEFNLTVRYGNFAVETFPNLTMYGNATRHIEKIVNAESGGSSYITATDLGISPGYSGALTERPANSAGSPTTPYGPLVGGDDGIRDNTGASILTEIDFIGDSASKTGFYSFDLLDDVELLICPEAVTPGVQNAALSYCSVTRGGDLFFIADPPAGLSPEAMNTYVVSTAALKNTSEHGAIYWPRIKILNPNPSVYGTAQTITIPPSGHIAGMFARTDGSKVGGVYDPPGGVEKGQLTGVVGVENEQVFDEKVRDLVAPNLINPITRIRGYPIAVDDVQTLLSTGNFPTVAERRGVSFIERSIKDGLQYARLRNNDDVLRDSVFSTIEAFLLRQMRSGAFRSTDPATAFFIDVSEALNPPSEQFAGKLNVRIGLATQKPARFIILSFSQDTRALDEELAAAS